MSDNSPAQRFLSALGINTDDSQREDLQKHNTLRGRPGDPHAPGDPQGYRHGIKPHKEIGGTGGPLSSQKPHGFRGAVNGGSVQTLMILLRKAARLFADKSIADWDTLLGYDEEEIWEEGGRIFGGQDRVRELIDSLPTRTAGENINIDDVPEDLLRQFARGSGSKVKDPAKPKKPKPSKPKAKAPKLSEEGVTSFLEREELEVEDIARLLEQLSDEGGDFFDPELNGFVWDWVFDEFNFADLSPTERKKFNALNHEQKVEALEQISRGVDFKDLKL